MNVIRPYAANAITSRTAMGLWDTVYGAYCKVSLKSSKTVYFYHAPECAVSDALLQAIPSLLEKYPGVGFEVRTVDMCCDKTVSPEYEKLAVLDKADVAEWTSHIPSITPGAVSQGLGGFRQHLVSLESSPSEYIKAALECRQAPTGPDVTDPPTAATIAKNRAELERAGHWMSGTLYYAGRFYHGIERFALLEQQLTRDGYGSGSIVTYGPSHTTPVEGAKLEVWLSPRSPYSYIALDRIMKQAVLKEGKLVWHGVEVVLRPTMPSAMRGVPIVMKKVFTILLDAARVAHQYDIPFGFICDPLGVASTNVLRVVCHLQKHHPGQEWVFFHAMFKAAWSQAVDLTQVANLVKVGASVEISADVIAAALDDPSWEATVASSREDLLSCGIWGVPSFRYNGKALWGQDRIWLVERWFGKDTTPEL